MSVTKADAKAAGIALERSEKATAPRFNLVIHAYLGGSKDAKSVEISEKAARAGVKAIGKLLAEGAVTFPGYGEQAKGAAKKAGVKVHLRDNGRGRKRYPSGLAGMTIYGTALLMKDGVAVAQEEPAEEPAEAQATE